MNFFEKIFKFLKEAKTEGKRIDWPTKKETLNYTLVVIAVFLVVALILGGFDYLISFFRYKFIFKIP